MLTVVAPQIQWMNLYNIGLSLRFVINRFIFLKIKPISLNFQLERVEMEHRVVLPAAWWQHRAQMATDGSSFWSLSAQ